MIRYCILVTSITCIALFSSLSDAQDLSKYRDFQLGMSLNSVLTQTQMKATETKIIHQRPALIQTLQWDQFHSGIMGRADFTPKADALRSLQFEFYNGDLFKMVATYDPTRTEGMTTDDIIDAISLLYGKATTPVGTVAVPNAIPSYNDSERVLARWEDAQYSYDLFHSSYGDVFSLVGFSKKLDSAAAESGRESDRLDKEEAPGKEAAQQIKQADDKRTAQEAARVANKPKFRP